MEICHDLQNLIVNYVLLYLVEFQTHFKLLSISDMALVIFILSLYLLCIITSLVHIVVLSSKRRNLETSLVLIYPLFLNASSQPQLLVDFPSKYFSNVHSLPHPHYNIINLQFNYIYYTDLSSNLNSFVLTFHTTMKVFLKIENPTK